MDNVLLPRVLNMNDLGITINTKLRWNQNIYNITNKANQWLWLVTIGYNPPIQAKQNAYIAMVRSLIE